MDPRCKATFLDDVEATVNACSDEAMPLGAEKLPGTEHSAAAAAHSSLSLSSSTTKRKEKSLSGLLQKITTAKKIRLELGGATGSTTWEKIDYEIKLNLYLPLIVAEADLLAWWKAHHMEEMPIISKVARKYLCVPATSVPSERVFSASGHILSPSRSKLTADSVKKKTCSHFDIIVSSSGDYQAHWSRETRLNSSKWQRAARWLYL